MQIRKAKIEDLKQIYSLGLQIPELKVSNQSDFMDKDELLFSINNKNGIFLCAFDEEKLLGFIYANMDDKERPFPCACIVYLCIEKQFRRNGIADSLYSKCEDALKSAGVKYIYSWGNIETDLSIVKFMEKQNFTAGHKYMWMDKKL